MRPKNHTVTSGEGCASKSARSDLGPVGNCETALVSGPSVGLSHTSGGLIPCILRAPKSHRNIGGRLREQERTLRPPPLPRTSWGRPNSTSIRPFSHISGGLVPRTLRAPKSHRNAGGRLCSKGARVRTRTTPPPPPPPEFLGPAGREEIELREEMEREEAHACDPPEEVGGFALPQLHARRR